MATFERPTISVESAQYVSIKYTERLQDAGVEPLVGSAGDSYENALADTVNGQYEGRWSTDVGLGDRLKRWSSLRSNGSTATTNRSLKGPIGNIPPTGSGEPLLCLAGLPGSG